MAENLKLELLSPSRSKVEMEKPVSDLGSGFFSITLTADDISGIIDDTYSYKLSQLDVVLKLGFVRVIEGEIIIFDDAELDAQLDFLLA